MVTSEGTWHMSRVHKRVLKLVNLFVQNLQKPYMFDLGTHSPLIYDALWSFCHIGGFWATLQNYFAVLHPCANLSSRPSPFQTVLWRFKKFHNKDYLCWIIWEPQKWIYLCLTQGLILDFVTELNIILLSLQAFPRAETVWRRSDAKLPRPRLEERREEGRHVATITRPSQVTRICPPTQLESTLY